MTQNSSPPQANQPQEPPLGLDFNQKWQLIQHFTDWIKHGDAKLQMLLTVEGVIVAGYGAFLPIINNSWSCMLWAANILFLISVILTFGHGFFRALQPYTKSSIENNIFFYGAYNDNNILHVVNNVEEGAVSKSLDAQIKTLGIVADRKFKSVKILELLVFCSVITFFILVILFKLFN